MKKTDKFYNQLIAYTDSIRPDKDYLRTGLDNLSEGRYLILKNKPLYRNSGKKIEALYKKIIQEI
jgi:hypothetical protein